MGAPGPPSCMLCPQYCSRSRRGTLGDGRHGLVASVDSLGPTLTFGSWPARSWSEAGCLGRKGAWGVASAGYGGDYTQTLRFAPIACDPRAKV